MARHVSNIFTKLGRVVARRGHRLRLRARAALTRCVGGTTHAARPARVGWFRAMRGPAALLPSPCHKRGADSTEEHADARHTAPGSRSTTGVPARRHPGAAAGRDPGHRATASELAGVSTAVLEGGDGPPMVLLHGPGEFAAQWLPVIPTWCGTHRVIAPDLPGHGASAAPAEPTRRRPGARAGSSELIEATCPAPPVLVGRGSAAPSPPGSPPATATGSAAWCWWTLRAGSVRAGTRVRAGAAPLLAATRPRHTLRRLFGQCFTDLDGLRRAAGRAVGAAARPTRSTRPARPDMQAALGGLMPRVRAAGDPARRSWPGSPSPPP